MIKYGGEVGVIYSDTKEKQKRGTSMADFKEDLTKICQLPVLGMIPDFAEVAKRAESDRERKEMHRK